MDISTISLVISIASALITLLLNLKTMHRNRYLAANEFLTKMEEKEFINARKHVYNETSFDINDDQAALVVNFFHHWGLLTQKHYLPIWVFRGASGRGVCRLHGRLNGFIVNRRIYHDDDTYAEYFDLLVTLIRNKYHYND